MTLMPDYDDPNNPGVIVCEWIKKAMWPFDPEVITLELQPISFDAPNTQEVWIRVKTLPDHVFIVPIDIDSLNYHLYPSEIGAYVGRKAFDYFHQRIYEPESHIQLGED